MAGKMVVVGVVIIIGVLSFVAIMFSVETVPNANDEIFESTNSPSVEVSDSTILEKNISELDTNNQNYSIDEHGNKKYSISAIDSPDLGD